MCAQGAHVHARKVRRSDTRCSNVGSASTPDRRQGLRGLRREIALCLRSTSLEYRQTRSTGSTASMILLGSSIAFLVSFTTAAANSIVRNSGEGNGLEAWRRLHSEYDPTSSMRRVAILQQVQNPPRCQRVEDLGSAPQDWLSKKRQYDMFTERDGRPCQASDDSLVAAMFRFMPKSLEETVMFTNEDEGFQEFFDRLAGLQQLEAVGQYERESKRQARDVRPCWLRERQQRPEPMSYVRCWNCGRFGHYDRDCRGKWSGDKGGGKSKGGRKERMAKAKASCTLSKAASGKNIAWKQERYDHIANKMKSMSIKDGGRRQMRRQYQVQDGG